MKRFIDCLIPFQTCNLRCHYCYITQTKSFGQKLPVFPYGADHIGRALAADRLGGVSLINVCGEGETLLPPEVVGIVHEILKQGHYVMVVTNGTIAKRFDEIAALPADCLERLLIKFSFHYLELQKRGWLDLFFNNVQKVRQAGASISVELTPSDEMIPHVDDAIAICRERAGAPCHVTVARDERNPELAILTGRSKAEYQHIWERFDSALFRFKLKVFGEKRREFCYAGLWSGTLDLVSGNLRQCYRGGTIQNVYENLDRPIPFQPIGRHCPEPHCYNAHAFMTLGVIPSVRTPRFAEMRDRICADGSEWLKPGFKAFISRKLGDENREWSRLERLRFEICRAWDASRIGQMAKSLRSRVQKKPSRTP
jgi:hypothetical protein